jgi:acetyl esterase/lipase
VDWARTRIGRPLWMRAAITPAVERHEIALDAHQLEVLVPPHKNERVVERVVLYVHGGGYIACSPATHRPLAARLAREWHAVAVVPDYRLAPETACPGGRNDVVATWRWMLDELGVDPASVIFAGDSAGGGLALSAMLACRDSGLPLPAAYVAFSPWVDLACTGDSLTENAERCAMFIPSQLRAAAELYAPAQNLRSPDVSPLYADLQGLPPMCVHVGQHELLRDDGLRLVERARLAGVTVESRSWPGVPHVWQFLTGFLPEARESLDDAAAFVGQHTRVGDSSGAIDRVRALVTNQGQRTASSLRKTTVP